MKKLFVIPLCILLCAMLSLWVFATDLPKVIDNADLLSSSEERSLSEKLDGISEELSCDIIVLTEDSIRGSAEGYADDYFDYNGYGEGEDRDGILLLVAMDEGEWHVSGSGICNYEFNDDAFDYICENIVDDLQSEEYARCFDTFADRCEEVISAIRDGEEFVLPFDFGSNLLISLVIGFVIAFIVTSVMKGQLNTVWAKAAASDYLKADSLHITDSRDMFLYRQVIRTKKVKNNGSGSHTSSSGRSHSGRGGRF